MEWPEVRRAARADVHETFAQTVEYTPPSGGASLTTTARLHTKYTRIGDLDREGYGQAIEEIERVIWLTEEARRIGARRGGTITDRYGMKWQLAIQDPQRDAFTIEFQVTQVKTPPP